MSINIILAIYIFLSTTTIAIFVLHNNYRNKVNKYFFFLCLSIDSWTLCTIVYDSFFSYKISLLAIYMAIIWVALMPIFFNELILNLYYLNDTNYFRKHRIIFRISLAVTAVIIIFSHASLNVKSISVESWGLSYQPGILYYILFFYLLLAFGFSFVSLIHTYRKFSEPHRSQAKFMLIGSFITVILSIFLDIVFPVLGYSYTSIFGPTAIIFFIGSVAFSISNHQLFNIKVIAVELVTFGLWVFMFLRVLLAKNLHDMFVDGGVLLITIVLGIILIQSILHIIKQDERLKNLTDDLQKAYGEIKELSKILQI